MLPQATQHSNATANPPSKLVEELSHQLDCWRDALPEPLQGMIATDLTLENSSRFPKLRVTIVSAHSGT